MSAIGQRLMRMAQRVAERFGFVLYRKSDQIIRNVQFDIATRTVHADGSKRTYVENCTFLGTGEPDPPMLVVDRKK